MTEENERPANAASVDVARKRVMAERDLAAWEGYWRRKGVDPVGIAYVPGSHLSCFRVDGVETYVAYDLDDLQAVFQETHGESWEQMVGDPFSVADVQELFRSEPLAIYDQPETYGLDPTRLTRRTVGEWISHHGRGLLCSTEW